MWQPLDCHAHTTFSDGALTPAELVARVRARGVRPGIADHISRDVKYAIKSLDAMRAYLDELEQYDVLRGGEFCWHDALWRELPDELAARFTHRIGSLHAVPLPGCPKPLSMFARSIPAGLTPDDYMEHHLAQLERLAQAMPVDILAHPTLLPLPLRSQAEELWTEEREERAVRALAEAGIAFEISARYRPHERIVRRAAAHGARLSLGSDGHSADHVGDLTFPLAMAHAAGLASEELYDPAVHGSRVPRLAGGT